MQVWQTQNEQQTEDAGRALAETLRGGEVITLRGDLVAGEAEELGEIGFEEYMQSDAVVVIEWAELFPEVLPARRISVQIEASGAAAAGRKICIWQEEELENA